MPLDPAEKSKLKHDLTGPLTTISGFAYQIKLCAEDMKSVLSESASGEKVEALDRLLQLIEEDLEPCSGHIEKSAQLMVERIKKLS